MAKITATIERYHVRGTHNFCVALYYRGQEFTPRESMTCPLPKWVPDDADGIESLKQRARVLRFTHVRFAGDWDKRTKPRGCAL